MRPAPVLIAILAAVAMALQPVTTAAQSATSSLSPSQIRIFNFGRVDATYYRGAQPSRQDYADLAALGIRTVIDLRKDSDDQEPDSVVAAGMAYVNIPMTTRVPPTTDQLAQFLRLVNDPVSQPVYVHCVEGRHRTGVMTAVYRMTETGWSAAQAFKEMKQYRFGFDFLHPEFKRFVFAYRAPSADAVSARAATAAR